MLCGSYYYYNTGPILSVLRVSALNTEGKQDRMVLQENYFLSQNFYLVLPLAWLLTDTWVYKLGL